MNKAKNVKKVGERSMKRKKKLISLVILVVLVLSMSLQVVVRASTQTEALKEHPIESSNNKKSELMNKQEKQQMVSSNQTQAVAMDEPVPQSVDRKNEKLAKHSRGISKIDLDNQYEWTEVKTNPKGEVVQKDGSTLVFGFDGMYKENADVKEVKFGKPNVYLKTADSKIIQTARGGDRTLNSTSGLYFLEKVTKEEELLNNVSYRKDLKVMTSTDENGHPVIRASMSGKYAGHDWRINAVLRVSADGQVVQQEYYLTNLGEAKEIAFGKSLNSAFTKQPILALGDNKGMSVLDGLGHKFNYSTSVEGGPENWNTGNKSFFDNFAPTDWTGNGIEAKNPMKESVIEENKDIGLKFKWKPRVVQPNETAHIRLDIRYVPHKNAVDKMYDWAEVEKNPKGEMKQADGDSLVYGFDGMNKEGDAVKNVNFGKPNVYLKTTDGKKIQHLYNGASNLSTTEGLLFIDNERVVNDILGNSDARSSFKVMTALDENGHLVIRANVISSYTKHDWEIDEILKASKDGQNIQHEYYITNLGKETEASIGRSVDTKLGNNDTVPIQAIGDNKGMFIESEGYRLHYRTGVEDGPDNWNGARYNNAYLSNFTPSDWTGAGVEIKKLPKDAIIANHVDTGLKMKWQPRKFKLDEMAHYRYDVGVSSNDQPLPMVEKSVENTSSGNQSESKLGDKLRYKIVLSNSGYDKWDNIKLTDILPEEVDQLGHVVLTHENGDTEELSIEDVYNAETRTLMLENKNLEPEQKMTLSFDVKVVENGGGKIVNVASATGKGRDGKTYTASDEVSIKMKDSAKPQVEKTVKNVNGSNEYLPGDTVQYSLKVKNANANIKNSWENILIQDAVPEDVTVDTASFHKTYTKTDGTKEESDLAKDIVWEESANRLKVNQAELRGTEEAVVTFKAKIKDNVANKLIQNKVEAISDEFEPFTAEASFNVAGQLEFISAPKSISFGKLPINSFDKTYKPKTWDQALQVKDSRSLTIAPKWSMLAKLDKPLTGNASAETITGLYYQADGERQMITEDDAAQVYVHSTTDSDKVTISDLWDDDTGLRLDVPAGKAKKDVYSGTLVWTLQDVPDSE